MKVIFNPDPFATEAQITQGNIIAENLSTMDENEIKNIWPHPAEKYSKNKSFIDVIGEILYEQSFDEKPNGQFKI